MTAKLLPTQNIKAILLGVSFSLPMIFLLNYREVKAATIQISDPNKKYSVALKACQGNDKTQYIECNNDAYLNLTHLTASEAIKDDSNFKKSFDDWNNKFQNGKWTLNNGGNLNAILDVGIFQAFADSLSGGVKIIVGLNYQGADKKDFFWTQGLKTNYTVPKGDIVEPYYKLDTLDRGPVYSPLYPFQANQIFQDGPTGLFPTSFFDAQLYLAKIDSNNNHLILYDGISYGFKLSAKKPAQHAVPEPLSILSSFVALGFGGFIRKKYSSKLKQQAVF